MKIRIKRMQNHGQEGSVSVDLEIVGASSPNIEWASCYHHGTFRDVDPAKGEISADCRAVLIDMLSQALEALKAES